jgi:hypothetical protein
MTQAQQKEVIRDDYCNDDFPVLSFAYALYCDTKFAELAHKLWLDSINKKLGKGAKLTAAALDDSGIYDDYLDDYIQNRKRVFPYAAIELITAKVAANPPVEGDLYAPTKEQVTEFVDKYLIPELTDAPAQPAGAARDAAPAVKRAKAPGTKKLAVQNPRRPVLSCLARIFVNQDPDFEKDPVPFLSRVELNADERRALVEFGESKRTYLTLAEAEVFAPKLEDEFRRAPYVW